MAQLKTIRWFLEWQKDEANVDEFFRLIVEERKRFREACLALKVPFTLMYPFVHDGGEMQKRYDLALKAISHDLMERRHEVAEGVQGTEIPAQVSAAKLLCEVYEGTAKKWDKDRYGEHQDAVRTAPVVIQIANLRGAPLQLASSAAVPACPKCRSVDAVTYADINEYRCGCGHAWVEQFPDARAVRLPA